MTGTTDLAVRNGHAPAQQQEAALAIRSGQTTFDEFQNAALNQLGLRNASNADRAVFLHQCQRTGLDPFAKQIYMIERGGKWTIQTGIDGWRVIRDRAEKREGVRAKLGRALFYDGDGNEYKVWVRAEPPAACSITLTIGGSEYTSALLFREYCQTDASGKPVAQWKTRGAHMLEKCVEADVYRKAFPQDFSGIYLDDAMPPDGEPAPQRQRVTADQARARNPQTVTAEVVTPDVPPAGEQPAPPAATPAPPQSAGGTPGPGPDPDDPAWQRALKAAQAQFRKITTDDSTRLDYARRILRVNEVPSFNDLTLGELREVASVVSGADSREQLDALLASGEVRDGE